MNECIECGGGLEMPEDPMAGEIVACAACGCELEITAVEPLTIALAPEIEEDWGE